MNKSEPNEKTTIIMEQPKKKNIILKPVDEFKYSNNYDEFLKKNNLNSCYQIKEMFHKCMDDKKNFSLCDYYYSMLMICGKLEYHKETDLYN